MHGNPGEDRPGLRVRRRLAHRPEHPGWRGGGGACRQKQQQLGGEQLICAGRQHVVAAAEGRGKGEDR